MKRHCPVVISLRLVLTGIMLIVAPAAALAHLLLHWMPVCVTVGRTEADVQRDTAAIRAAEARIAAVQTQQRALAATGAHRDPAAAPWLGRRDRDGVFDRIAEAFRDPRVAVERLTLNEPGLYAAASRKNLLACERVAIDCTGSYEALADCLDRLVGQELPLRVERLSWSVEDDRMRLTANIEAPFVPDAELAAQLADAARLRDEEVPDEP